MQPRDYDSTLARMAGNIAAGLMGGQNAVNDTPDRIALASVAMAAEIIRLCRQCAAPAPTPERKAP